MPFTVLPLAHFTLDVTVDMRSGATAIYGPSGSGKTSLIETIAGLRRPRSGTITVNGRVVDQGDAVLPGVTTPREGPLLLAA